MDRPHVWGPFLQHSQPSGPASVSVGRHQPREAPTRGSQAWSLPFPPPHPASYPNLVSPPTNSPQMHASPSDIHFKGSAVSLQDLICRSGISSSGPSMFALVQMASRCTHPSSSPAPAAQLLSRGKLILTPTSHPPPCVPGFVSRA